MTNGCEWAEPIYIHSSEINTLTEETKRQILEHNKTWKEICN